MNYARTKRYGTKWGSKKTYSILRLLIQKYVRMIFKLNFYSLRFSIHIVIIVLSTVEVDYRRTKDAASRAKKRDELLNEKRERIKYRQDSILTSTSSHIHCG